MTKGRKLRFPSPGQCKRSNLAILCPAERVIGLYNQSHTRPAKKVAAKVRNWFTAEALKKGWAGLHFLPELPSGYGAGCVMWPTPLNLGAIITVTAHTLVLAYS